MKPNPSTLSLGVAISGSGVCPPNITKAYSNPTEPLNPAQCNYTCVIKHDGAFVPYDYAQSWLYIHG